MRSWLTMGFALLCGSLVSAPSVTEVTARQRYPWNGLVDVGFTISGDGNEKMRVTIVVNDLVGGTNLSVRTLYKENGTLVSDSDQLASGTYKWIWNAQADCGAEKYERLKMSVTAKDVNPRYMVVDLSKGTNASSYPVNYLDDIPSGGWTDEYRTTKLVLRRIDPGSFIMGENQTIEEHRVRLTKSFYLGVFEVTEKQCKLVMGTSPSSYGDMRPAVNVMHSYIWGSSNTFVEKLKQKTGGYDFKLPTEAQWEYACRAGTTSKYHCGDIANGYFMWFEENSGGSVHTVGKKNPNAWGLYDMHGNVHEKCLDWVGTLSYGTDPTGPKSGDNGRRIARGGGYGSGANECTSYYRGYYRGPYGDVRDQWTGFRICVQIR